MNDIYILAIETSCDETAAAVVKNGREVLSNVILSQVDIHKKYGGVVPEIASRNHLAAISQIVTEAMDNAGLSFSGLNAVAVTNGPGLAGALLAGLSYAKGLAYAIKKPIIGVHHIEGHICANFIGNDIPAPPFICLVASGGHTHLVLVKDFAKYEVIGRTRDDACGEAYDKVARALGLGYPGGPLVDALACTGNPNAIYFPRALLDDSFDFSFSGLKSAVLNHINKCAMTGNEPNKPDIAAAFQQAVIDVLVNKAVTACKVYGNNTLALAGGVSSNSTLRRAMNDACLASGIALYIPSPVLCTDNAVMIAVRAFFDYKLGRFDNLDLNAYPNRAMG